MKFNIFGYTVTILKTKTIEQKMVEVLLNEGKVAAVKFYRNEMLRVNGVVPSLKEAVDVMKKYTHLIGGA